VSELKNSILSDEKKLIKRNGCNIHEWK
jgi:hypothetical protein